MSVADDRFFGEIHMHWLFVDLFLLIYSMVSAVEKSFEFIIAGQILYTSITVCCFGVQVIGVSTMIANKNQSHL